MPTSIYKGWRIILQVSDRDLPEYRIEFISDASYSKEIGRMAFMGGIQFFDGMMDEVKVFGRVLSEEEILGLATNF